MWPWLELVFTNLAERFSMTISKRQNLFLLKNNDERQFHGVNSSPSVLLYIPVSFFFLENILDPFVFNFPIFRFVEDKSWTSCLVYLKYVFDFLVPSVSLKITRVSGRGS